MRSKRRLDILESEVRDLKYSYKDLLDGRINFMKDLKRTLDNELASYRSAVQGTQTDRIKFDVLEEWINEVFKLNNLKFSEKDFIDRNQRDIIEAEIREQIAREIETHIDSDSEARAFTLAADIARGGK